MIARSARFKLRESFGRTMSAWFSSKSGPSRGTVKWFDAKKGYGFIVPEDGIADVFLHRSDVCIPVRITSVEKSHLIYGVQPGTGVAYFAHGDPRDQKKASSVTGLPRDNVYLETSKQSPTESHVLQDTSNHELRRFENTDLRAPMYPPFSTVHVGCGRQPVDTRPIGAIDPPSCALRPL